MFMTRYVPEFLKHFRGSLTKATRSKTFETAPRIQIMINGEMKFVNSLATQEVVVLDSTMFSINCDLVVTGIKQCQEIYKQDHAI